MHWRVCFISCLSADTIEFRPQLDSVRRIFDEHRRQDILMIQERDEFQRSINQEDVDDYHECIWIYDSNLCRELLKCSFLRRFLHCNWTHFSLQPKHDRCGARLCGESLWRLIEMYLYFIILLQSNSHSGTPQFTHDSSYICEFHRTHPWHVQSRSWFKSRDRPHKSRARVRHPEDILPASWIDTHRAHRRYSRRMFGIQAYWQLCAPTYNDSTIETRLEESVHKVFSEKLGGWLWYVRIVALDVADWIAWESSSNFAAQSKKHTILLYVF